jgi:tetratricopeptide (TPR) repeat protein
MTADAPDPNARTGGLTPPALPVRYGLGERIAVGGMGVVYRAADTVLGRDVAIKVLQDRFGAAPAAVARFRDEAMITAQLQHPAIPPVHDLGALADGRPFLAMKLIKGDTLADRLAARPTPGHERGHFVAVFEQVCQALACAHDRMVVHRDLKPANVMVGRFGEVQVMDWGLAKVLDPGAALPDPGRTGAGTEINSLRDSDGTFTQAGSVLGTPAFMPPEQAIGASGQVDARSDVFGLGGILAAVLTGAPPFVAATGEDVRLLAARGKVDACFARLDACGADPELVALCKRCLAPEKGDRPADAGAVARAVAELRAAADERARAAELERVRLEGARATSAARALERGKRRRLAVAAAVVLALALVGGLSAVLVVQRRANADLAAKNEELTAERTRAEQRLELALKAIATLHTGVGEDMLLKSAPYKELRNQLLKQAADFYGKLEGLLVGATDAKSRRLLADGYFQLGELSRRTGSPTEALALHRKALAIRSELAGAAGANAEARLDVARSLGETGWMLLETNDVEGALRAFAEQRDTVSALEAKHPTPAGAAVLARSYADSASALHRMGQLAQATEASQRAVAIHRALVATNPDAEFRPDLARSLQLLGALLWDLGRWTDALAAMDEARVTLLKAAGTNPSFTSRFRLGNVQCALGSTLFDQGRAVESLVVCEEARATLQALVGTHPAVTNVQVLLASASGLAAQALGEVGAPDAATSAFKRVCENFEDLRAANPIDVELCYRLARMLNSTGQLYTRTGRPGEALRYHERARALMTGPARENPSFGLMQNELSRSYAFAGRALLGLEKRAEALDACREAVAIRQKLRDTQPALNWVREELAESLADLGTAQRGVGRPAEGVASFRRAIELVEPLPELTPRDHFNLARYHALLAAVAADPGAGLAADTGAAEVDRAMTALRRAVATGFSGAVRVRTDPDLGILGSRADFQKLLRELEARFPPPPEVAPPPREKQ